MSQPTESRSRPELPDLTPHPSPSRSKNTRKDGWGEAPRRSGPGPKGRKSSSWTGRVKFPRPRSGQESHERTRKIHQSLRGVGVGRLPDPKRHVHPLVPLPRVSGLRRLCGKLVYSTGVIRVPMAGRKATHPFLDPRPGSLLTVDPNHLVPVSRTPTPARER